MSVAQETLGSVGQAPEQLEFKRLPTWKQLGLGGLCDCTHEYFRTNLSMLTVWFSFLFVFLIVLNLDRDFNIEAWDGLFTGTIACEEVSGDFVSQKIDATSSFAYVCSGLLILLLGIYDVSSWKERDALYKATHFLNDNEIATQRQLIGGGVGDEGQRRSFVSVQTNQTNKTTFSVEHEEIVTRRKYSEYIMGKKGSPSLIIRQPLWSLLFGLSLLSLSFTGLLFHASLTNTAKRLDDFSLWVVISLLVGYAWARYVSDGISLTFCRKLQDNPRRSSICSTIFFLGCSAAADFAFYLYLDDITDRDFVRAAFIGALVLFSIPMFLHYCYNKRRVESSWTLLLVSIALIGLGFLLNELDVPDSTLCFEESFFQAHALWHVLSSVSVVLLIMFFRSDFYATDVPIDEENSPRLITTLTNFNPRAFLFGNGGTVADDESVGGVRRVHSRASEGRRKPVRNEDQETIEMWFCMKCEFSENSMDKDLKCKQCGKQRPSMDQFIAIPMNKTGGARQSSKHSVTSSHSARTRKRLNKTGRRPNSNGRAASVTRRVNNNEGNKNPNVQQIVNVGRRNVIRSVTSQGSGSVAGKSVSTSRSAARSRPRLASNGRVRSTTRTRNSRTRNTNDAPI